MPESERSRRQQNRIQANSEETVAHEIGCINVEIKNDRFLSKNEQVFKSKRNGSVKCGENHARNQ